MLRCPSCSVDPDPLHDWRCAACEEGFDPFATRACCPICATIAWETACPSCDAVSPHVDWYADPGVREAYARSGREAPRCTRSLVEVRAQVFLDADALRAAAPDQRHTLELKLAASHKQCENANRAAQRTHRRKRPLEGGILSAGRRLLSRAVPAPRPRRAGQRARWFVGAKHVYRAEERFATDSEGAISDCAEALRLLADQDDSPERRELLMRAHRARACARVQLEDADGALADCDEAVRLEPDDFWSHAVRGEVHLLRNAWKDAAADFGRVIELKPSSVRAYSYRAHALLAGDEAKRAMEDMRRALALYPEWAEMFVMRAQARVALDQLPDALVDLDRALRLDADLSRAANWRAGLRLFLGDREGGLADMRRAIELEAEQAPEFSLLLLAALTGDTERLQALPASDGWPSPLARFFCGGLGAKRLLEIASATDAPQERDKRVARVHGLLGIDAERRGDTAEALRRFEACLAVDAVVGETYWARGRWRSLSTGQT